MRDGYYISTYIHIDSLAHLYNTAQRHDPNISLWHKSGNKVKLVHYWELERLTGIKQNRVAFYDTAQAKEFIEKLLKEYNLRLDDIVDIWGTPQLDTDDNYHSVNDFPGLSYHSISHLFSALMCDTDKFYNDNIIGLAVDGGPDSLIDKTAYKKDYYAGCVVQKGKMQIFPVFSPGALWQIAAGHFKLREGTLMALASASNSKAFIQQQDTVLIKNGDDIGKLYEYFWSLVRQIEAITEKNEGTLFNGFDSRFTQEESKISMVMKEIQNMSQKIMEKNINDIILKYGIDPKDTYLALAGGYALNCPSNTYLVHRFNFKGFIAPPCVSDTGMSLGNALYAFYKKIGKFDFKMEHAYYGCSDNDLDAVINKEPFHVFIKNVSEIDLQQAVADIEESPVVWFNGAAEIGPRALGNRSILADPRKESSKEQLNKIKQRQWWRPVAPIILQEALNEWFEDSFSSPYMLHTFKVKKDKVGLVPAIAHLDGSARVQTICDKGYQHQLYKLVKCFEKNTGIPILCNTSLNDKGEPIINKIPEALNFALRKGIKVVYINGKRIELHNHSKYLVNHPLERDFNFMKFSNEEKEALRKKLNPHNIPQDILLFYHNLPEMNPVYDLTNKKDARELVLRARYMFNKFGV